MNDSLLSIAIVIEGRGEERAAAGLIRRVLGEFLGRYDISRIGPIRANGKPDLVGNLERFLRIAVRENADAILVLVDADDECPVEEARSLGDRASALNLGVPVAVVCAKSEYETWFISSLSEGTGEGIRARLNIDPSVNAPEDVEGIRGAKEWLRNHTPQGQRYKATLDQEGLTYHIDMNVTYRRSRSFRRLCHAVEELVEGIDGAGAVVTPRGGRQR